MLSISELTCRVCLQEQHVLINIFDELDELQTNLCNLLEKCGDMKVEENDVFPKYLCEECTRELLISAKFRDKCEKSKEMFLEVLKEHKVDDDTDTFTQIIEYSTEERQHDFPEVSEEMDDMFSPHPSNENVQQSLLQSRIEEHESETIEFVEKVNNSIIIGPNLEEVVTEAVTQEVVCSEDSVITYDGEPALMNADDTSPTVVEYNTTTSNENNDYEVHIDLSDTAIMKPMPLKARKLTSFKCDICGAVFVQAINLQKHMQKNHPPMEVQLYKPAANSEVDTKKSIPLPNNIDKAMESQRRCVYCDREFQTPFSLKMHLRTHTGERPFLCQYCDKAFKTQSSLSTHIKRHIGQADFVCNICGKLFYERGNLDVHMRSHTGERPHSCQICQKTFSRVFLLELHMRTHTGEKPYACSFCEKSFRQRSDWKSHLSTHTGVKQYNCQLCSKGYVKRTSLVQHMRTHAALQVDLENNDMRHMQQSEIVHSFEDIIESEEVFQAREVS